MQVELFGCTSAGKSTLASNIFQTCRKQGIELLLSDDFVLKQMRLNWIRSSLVRLLLLDLFLLSACLATWRYAFEFFIFVLRFIPRLPVSQFEKLNLVRNVLKRIGTYEIIRRCGSDRQVVLVDGGIVQAAHHLFVHVSVPANASDLSTFVRLVPVPDVAVYVRQRESILIERAMRRKHRRVTSGSQGDVEIFVKRATETFDKLVQQSVSEGRLSIVNNQRHIFVARGYQNYPLLVETLAVIREAIDTVLADRSNGIYA